MYIYVNKHRHEGKKSDSPVGLMINVKKLQEKLMAFMNGKSGSTG